jgi:hypothetical protein
MAEPKNIPTLVTLLGHIKTQHLGQYPAPRYYRDTNNGQQIVARVAQMRSDSFKYVVKQLNRKQGLHNLKLPTQAPNRHHHLNARQTSAKYYQNGLK